MKVLKFLIAVCALYVAIWIFWAGLEAIWTFCVGLGMMTGLVLAVFIFAILPTLLIAWAVFKW